MTVKELSEISGLSVAARQLVRDDSIPSTYLDSLEKQELYEDAVRFQAYKMPVHPGIQWASNCIDELRDPALKSEKDAPFESAGQWLKAPGDPTRYAARDAADKPDATGPSRLLALAVFFSGGSVASPESPTAEPPPYSAQQLIAGAVTIAVVGHEAQHAVDRYKKALAIGKMLDVPGN